MRLTQFASSITLALLLLIGQKVLGTHILSTDGYVKCLDTNSQYSIYEFHMSSLRDASSSTVPFDLVLELGIYGKLDGKLKTRIDIPLIQESVVEEASINGSPEIYEASYFSIDTLPKLEGGYVLQFRRCCLPQTKNFSDDEGLELLVFIPSKMGPGQHTLKAIERINPILQKKTTNTFTYPWTHNLYDSIRFVSMDFYVGGDQSNPLPTPSTTLTYGSKGLFKNGAKAGSPFGQNGTWDKTSDSTFQVRITQSGYYLYPISTTCYLRGDSFMQTVLFPAIVVDTLAPQLVLKLVTVDVSHVTLASTARKWNSIDSLVLQRGYELSPSSIRTILSPVAIGADVIIKDTVILAGKDYKYRLKLVSGGQTYYSNSVSIQTFWVGVSPTQEQSKLQIYPNPAHQSLHLTSPESGTYSLFSSDGKYMKSGELREGENTLTLENLSPGVYFIRTNFRSAKFIVAHP